MAERKGYEDWSSRHTGDRYSVGYQYRPRHEVTVSTGPWIGVASIHDSSNANVGDDRYLAEVSAGVLRGGRLYTFGRYTGGSTVADYQVVGAHVVTVGGSNRQLLFRRTGDPYLEVVQTYKSSTATHTSTITYTNPQPVDVALWGNTVYFSSAELSSIYTYNIVTGAFATLAGSPSDMEYLLVVDNNLCAVGYDTTDNAWKLHWAVDSDPTDWSSEGSGNQPIPPELGDVIGFERVGESAVILGSRGAMLMTPTGTLPAFRFQQDRSYPGAWGPRAAASDGDTITLIAPDGYLRYWMPGQPAGYYNQDFTVRIAQTPVEVCCKYLQRNGLMAVAFGVGEVAFLDPSKKVVVGRWNDNPGITSSVATSLFITEGFQTSGGYQNTVSAYVSNSTADEYAHLHIYQEDDDANVSFKTHTYHFDTPVEITAIEFMLATAPLVIGNANTVTLLGVLPNGAEISKSYGAISELAGSSGMYWLPVQFLCQSLKLTVALDLESTQTSGAEIAFLDGIRLHVKLAGDQ